MRRYRILVKGSVQERTWLNQLANKGWLLTAVHGWTYQFKAVHDHQQVLTEYVPLAVETTAAPNTLFQLLTVVPLPKIGVKVVYSATTAALPPAELTLTSDEHAQLKATLGLRAQLLNCANWWTIGIVILLAFLLAILQDHGPSGLYVTIVLIWLIGLIYLLVQLVRVHRPATQLRARLQDYDGAWRPTMHVFLRHATTPLDLKAVASLGHWRIVGHSKKGDYWYDVQTNATQAEIKQALQPVVAADVEIHVMSYLGLWPI